MNESYWTTGARLNRIEDTFGGGKNFWTERGLHTYSPYSQDQYSIFAPDNVNEALWRLHNLSKNDYGNGINLAGGAIDDFSGTKLAGKVAGRLAVPIDFVSRGWDNDGFTLKDGLALSGGIVAGLVAEAALVGSAVVSFPAVTAAAIGVAVSYAIDALPIPDLPDPAPSFRHNSGIGFQSINPSTAYVPTKGSGTQLIPDISKPEIPNTFSIPWGVKYNSISSSLFSDRADEIIVNPLHVSGGWNVLILPSGYEQMSRGEAGRIADQIERGYQNDVSKHALATAVVEGYDRNGPETAIDLPRTHYSGNSDGGSSYGNPDAGGRAASGADRNSGTAQDYSDSSGSSGWFGGNGPGDGSIAPGTGGGSSGGGATQTPRSKPNNNNGDRDGNNRGNDSYNGGRDNGSGSSYGNSDAGGGGSRGPSSSSTNTGGAKGGFGCFVAGTSILLADGSEKPIEKIGLEDLVMAFDGLGALEPREVTDLFVHGKRQVLDVDGVLTTPEHPFLLSDGSYKPVGMLSVGDRIVRTDGSLHTIENIHHVDGVHTVYNFTVECLHTYVAAGFRVHNIKPVILDLDGNGIEVSGIDRSTVYMDASGEGLLHRTAWAGQGDGVLYFDPDGRNEITEKRQFVFTEWDPTSTSDLEALASVFDSNGDGVLNATDTDFQKFKVMVTLADGSTVSKTLAELGITEINLTADASNIELSDGSVITGKSTFTRADGSTGTIGDMLLASEKQGHRVVQAESVDGSGMRSLTTTAYAADGSKAYEILSEVSSDGLSVTNRYDDDGDGVIDRIQIIETVVNGDGSRTETERNFSGSDLATAILTSREVTTKSADHKVEIIERDSMGGGWFDQRETRTEAVDGSLTIEVENLAQDGTVITSTSETVSLDGSERIDGLDADGDGAADTVETHLVDKHADDSRTETVTVTNQDGSLRSKTVEEVESDNRSKVITRDFDGDGQTDQSEILDITVSPDGGSTSRLEIRNGDGSLKSSSVTVTSDDALSKTTELDRDGDGDIDLTTADATTVNADGSRERIVTETNGDGSIRAMRKESLDADKVGQEVFVDLDQNGSFEVDELMSSVVVDATTLERTATQWTRSADGSTLAKTTSVTSSDGLTRTTESDLDGDGDIDLKVSDVTVQNGDGSSSRTVTTKNQDNSLRTIKVTETSADGLTKTVREDVDGDGAFEKKSVNTLVLESDGGTTRTASAYAGDETTLLSRTVTSESADRRTRTVTVDRDGDGTVDSTSIRVKGTDGAITQTVTETAADGTILGELVSTTSANGLVTATATDLDGDQVADVITRNSTTLNADGSKTTVQTTENADGSLRNTSIVTVSDDGLNTVSKTDADGNGTFERTVTDETVLGTDGGATRTVETRAQSGQLLSRTQIETSDDGLVTVQKTDRDGDGSFDVVETTTTVLEANGDTVTTTETREGGVLRSSTTQTVSDDGRSRMTDTDVNGDGKTDVRITQTIADTGVATTLTQSFNTSGAVQTQSRTVTSANGLSVTTSQDVDGNGAYDIRSESVRVLNADGSATTTTSAKAQNGTLQSRVVETLSADGLTTTRAQDFDGDGQSDESIVREAVIAPDGTITTTGTVTARNGDLLGNSVETVTGDGRSSTLATDVDGNGEYDRVITTTVGDDGTTTTTASSYSSTGDLIARTTSTESGNGQARTISFDLDGDGSVERMFQETMEIAADGTTTRSSTHEAGSGELLASEQVVRSSDGLTVTTALDLDGVGGDDFVTTKTTEFGADGSTLETWTTQGSNGQAGGATRTTSGDGLDVTTNRDLDGDGDTDRVSTLELGAAGGRTQTTIEYGTGTTVQRSETFTLSADGRHSETIVDDDGDGKTDLRITTQVDLSGNETTSWKDLATNGSTPEAIITKTAAANGSSETYTFDTDADGNKDISRTTRVSHDTAGNEISVFEEKEGSAGVLTFRSTTTTSANGLTSTTAIDSDGDGVIDTRSQTKTVYNADGSVTTTSRDWHEADGAARSSYSETISADGRKVAERYDFDGNGTTDKLRVSIEGADGSLVVTETGFGNNGAQKRAVTTTSSDGLTTTVLRDGVTQTFTRSELDNGSYDWDNGVISTGSRAHIKVSHRIDAEGVETWEMVSRTDGSTTTYLQRFDAEAKARLLTEAARIYDTVLDRDMDASEIEVLVRYTANSQLNLTSLAGALLASSEFSTRYSNLSDTGYIAQLYQNTFGREPSLDELADHLAALKSGAATRAATAATLAQMAEHIVVGNGHGKTNNYDVHLLPVVAEDDLRASFGVGAINMVTDKAKVRAGSTGNDTLHGDSGGFVFGRAGHDTLHGTSGSEILVGGTGNDTLRGGTGNDTYVFNRGDGNDVIIDDGSSSNGDTLLFGPGIKIEDLTFNRSGDHLVIGFYPESAAEASAAAQQGLGPLNGSVTIRYWFSDGNKRIERFAFEDGDSYWFAHISSFWSEPGVNINMFRRQGTGNDTFSADPGSDIIVGAEGNDTLHGNDGNDVLLGGEGNDQLFGNNGNDVLDAGQGTRGTWQMLRGGSGDDTYIVRANSGDVLIDFVSENEFSGTDTIVFSDLNLSDITATLIPTTGSAQNGVILKLFWNSHGTTGQIQLGFQGKYIERYEFADGTTLGKIGIHAIHNWLELVGTSGNDYIKVGGNTPGGADGRHSDDYHVFGGGGNDTLVSGKSDWRDWQQLAGQAGNDTYIIGSDGGSMMIDHAAEVANGGIDTVRFKDLTLSNLIVSYFDHNSVYGVALSLRWTQDETRLAGDLDIANRGQYIERYEFADGTTLGKIRINAVNNWLELVGTAGNDYIKAGGITPGGTDGRHSDDYHVFGGDGNDTLESGKSDLQDWQQLAGQAGNDTYVIGSDGGSIMIDHVAEVANGGTDTVRFKDLAFSDLVISNFDHNSVYGVALRFRWTENEERLAGDLDIANNAEHIERYEFADGMTVSKITVLSEGGLLLQGTAGTDKIFGQDESDELRGEGGNDVLLGKSGDDRLFGGMGNDVLEGGLGNDTLTGGAGDDTLNGGEGQDTYVYKLGDGNDILINRDIRQNTLILNGIDPEEVAISQTTDGVKYSFTDGGSLLLRQEAVDASVGLDRVVFDDGTVWRGNYITGTGISPVVFVEIEDQLLTEDAIWTFTVPADTFNDADGDVLSFSATLSDGSPLPSWLSFDASTKTFSGTPPQNTAGTLSLKVIASDGTTSVADEFSLVIEPADLAPVTLTGTSGDDDFTYNLGDGNVAIVEGANMGGGDRLLLGAGITVASVTVSRSGSDGNNAMLHFADGGQVELIGQFAEGWLRGIEQVVFEDGTIWDTHSLANLIFDQLATEGDDQISGFADGSGTMKGLGGNDTLEGTAATERIEGGAGNDIINGNGGGDSLFGNDGDDQISGGDGVQFIDGGAGHDVIDGGNGNDIIWSRDGDDEISVGFGDDFVNAGAGNDTIIFKSGETGHNTIGGFAAGAGSDDVLQFDVSVFADFAAVLAAASDDGTNTTITVDANTSVTLENVLVSQLHADDFQLVSQDATTTLTGTSGDDDFTYNLGDGNVAIVEGANMGGGDRLLLGAGITVASVTVSRSGSDGNNAMLHFADGGQVELIGQFAEGWLRGIEQVVFEDGTIWDTHSLANLIFDQLATEGDDQISGFADGSGTMKGLGGNDTLEGTAATERIEGGAGNDIINGNGGGDSLFGNDGDDQISGGDGVQFIDGGAGHDVIDGGNGNDIIWSRDGDDEISVGFGDDFVNAGAGNDTIIFKSGETGHNTIGGFAAGAGSDDVLQFDVSVFADFAAVLAAASDDGTNTTITVDANTSVTLENVLVSQLHADDFQLVSQDATTTLTGTSGDDDFTYNLGDGNVAIVEGANMGGGDRLLLGAGITVASVTVSRSGSDGNNAMLHFADGGQVELIGQFAEGWLRGIEQVVFEDGTIWDTHSLANLIFDQLATEGDDQISGFADGSGTMKGLGGNDTLEGTAATERIEGGAGNDIINGNGGGDSLFGNDGDDQISGGDGVQFIDGGAGHDVIDGGNGNDIIWSRDGDDEISVGFGDDFVNAGAGNDTIIFKSGETGHNTIGGFAAGAGSDDVLQFDVSVFADFAAVLAAASDDGTNTTITVDANTSVALENVLVSQLHQDDFQFV